jgi:solute carrier family 25 uncoupling protein 8/9
MLGTVATIAREEGASSLWKGIEPGGYAPGGAAGPAPARSARRRLNPPPRAAGIHRQVLFGGLRIGLYEPVSPRRRRPPARRAAPAPPLRRPAAAACSCSARRRPPAFLPAAQVKTLYVGKDHVGDVPLHLKIAAGLTTGALGISVASPTDLVKVGGL